MYRRALYLITESAFFPTEALLSNRTYTDNSKLTSRLSPFLTLFANLVPGDLSRPGNAVGVLCLDRKIQVLIRRVPKSVESLVRPSVVLTATMFCRCSDFYSRLSQQKPFSLTMLKSNPSIELRDIDLISYTPFHNCGFLRCCSEHSFL